MSEIALAIAVQHHPARADLVPPLLDRLGIFELVVDPEPEAIRSPLRTYREALERTPEWATHVLVFQDDAWPCPSFRDRAEAALAERPEDVVCFFCPGGAGLRRPVLRAAAAGDRWAMIRLGSWVPTVASSYPVAVARELAAFLATPRIRRQRGDDGPVTQFCRRMKIQPWATVPSLVQHADRVPSLIGRTAAAGRNAGRVAALYEGDDDPRA